MLPEEEVMAREEEEMAMNLAASLAETMTSEERDIFAFKLGNLPDRELGSRPKVGVKAQAGSRLRRQDTGLRNSGDRPARSCR